MLKELTVDRFEELYKLMEESFPDDERRSLEEQKSLLYIQGYRVYIFESNREIAAFFATWRGPDFVFLEHFAVRKNHRNKGLGAKLLTEFLQLIDQPVVIEIEPPDGVLEKRRAAFYERNGFKLSHYSYIQPALSKGLNSIPLVLMSYPEPLRDETFQAFKDWVFHTVYS